MKEKNEKKNHWKVNINKKKNREKEDLNSRIFTIIGFLETRKYRKNAEEKIKNFK